LRLGTIEDRECARDDRVEVGRAAGDIRNAVASQRVALAASLTNRDRSLIVGDHRPFRSSS